MSKYFYQKVFNEISSDMQEGCKFALGFDKEGYYIGIATTKNELKKLILNKSTAGIITDCSSVAYDFKGNTSVSGVDLIDRFNLHDYANEQLNLTCGNDLITREQELLYNNHLTFALNELVNEGSGKCISDLSCIGLDNNPDGRLPMFRSILVQGWDTFNVFITGEQITLNSIVGDIKVHNYHKDIDVTELADLLALLLDVDHRAVFEVISM